MSLILNTIKKIDVSKIDIAFKEVDSTDTVIVKLGERAISLPVPKDQLKRVYDSLGQYLN